VPNRPKYVVSEMRQRTLLAAVAVGVAAATLLGTGGFSVAVIDRPVAVSVAENQAAFVGLDEPDEPRAVEGGEGRVAIVEITNRLPADAGVLTTEGTVRTTTAGATVSGVDWPGGLSPGASGTATAHVDCGSDTRSVTVAVEVDAGTGDIRAEGLTHETTVRCPLSDESAGQTPGAGQGSDTGSG
jgi:hypothetical protein